MVTLEIWDAAENQKGGITQQKEWYMDNSLDAEGPSDARNDKSAFYFAVRS